MNKSQMIEHVRRSMEMFVSTGLDFDGRERMHCAVNQYIDDELSAMSPRDIFARFGTARDYTDHFFSYLEREMPGLLCDMGPQSDTIISWCSTPRVR